MGSGNALNLGMLVIAHSHSHLLVERSVDVRPVF